MWLVQSILLPKKEPLLLPHDFSLKQTKSAALIIFIYWDIKLDLVPEKVVRIPPSQKIISYFLHLGNIRPIYKFILGVNRSQPICKSALLPKSPSFLSFSLQLICLFFVHISNYCGAFGAAEQQKKHKPSQKNTCCSPEIKYRFLIISKANMKNDSRKLEKLGGSTFSSC